MGFKKGRKPKSEFEQNSRSRKYSRRRKSSTRVHSYAIRFYSEALFVPNREWEIGLFRLQPVNPSVDTHDVLEKFRVRENYGKFAPFRNQICCELVTNEDDWAELRENGTSVKFSKLASQDRLSIIQGYADAIILLMRIRGMTHFTVPVELSGSTFQKLRFSKNRSVSSRFRLTQALIDPIFGPNPPKLLMDEDFDWISKHIQNLMQLSETGRFTFLHDVFDTLNYPNPAVQLVQVWAGIESIVKSKSPGTRRSIRARCAMLLRDTEKEQWKLYKKMGKLYDFRCNVVHGNKEFSIKEWMNDLSPEGSVKGKTMKLFDSFEILKELMVKVIQDGEMPSKKKLEKMQNEFERVHDLES